MELYVFDIVVSAVVDVVVDVVVVVEGCSLCSLCSLCSRSCCMCLLISFVFGLVLFISIGGVTTTGGC